MSITDKLEAVKVAYKKRRAKRRWRHIGALLNWLANNRNWTRHYSCAKLGTASKNTKVNPNNIRASKSRRPSGHHRKHYAFKYRYNLP